METCKHFLQGDCKFGESCRLSHPKLDTFLCRYYFNEGFCKYGSGCKFLHQNLENANAIDVQMNPLQENQTTRVGIDIGGIFSHMMITKICHYEESTQAIRSNYFQC